MQLPALRCCGSASSAWPCLLHGSAKRTYTFIVRLLSRRTALNRTPMTTRGPVLRAARHGSSCRSGSLMWAFLRVSWGALFLDLRWRHSARAAMETMAQSSVSQMHGCLPASCERCTEQPWCLAPPSPPLSRLIGWPQNSGPYSGHPSRPPSLPPHRPYISKNKQRERSHEAGHETSPPNDEARRITERETNKGEQT